MFKNEYTLTVDLKKKMTAIVPKFVQYDNATLVFKIFDGGKSYDLTSFTRAEVAHKRPDGQVVVGTGIIETLSSGEKVVRYNYLGSEMNNTGYVETSLSIFSTDEKVSILPFKVEIFKDNRDGLIENAKEQVGLLQELIADVSAILDEANTAIDNANNAVIVANKATTDANTAITNANLAITEAQNAANATIQVKDDTLVVKDEAEQATINANNAVSNLVHKGEYNPIASYVPRNIVSFDGSSYMNIVPSTGISPTDNAHWKLIGKKGDTGLQGIQGIKGDKGDKGDTGKGFSIAKTYPSVAAMYADYNNASIPIGSFVLINTSDINNVENAMLFVKTNIEYSYLTDLSGAQGIQGERGLQGIQGIQGIQGVKGDKGDKGDAGIDGLGFTWRGIYNSIENYNLNDAVYYEGSSFVALKPITGITPQNDGINWSMMAQRGVDGTGSVSSVNTKLPNVNGDVTLTPSDIGASPSDHTHSELHTHSNKTVLDKFSESNGNPQYNGTPIGAVASVNGQVGDVTGLETVTDSNNKLATKVDKVTGKGLSTEDFTTTEKTKLSGIADNANNYTHPTTAGNKHIPTGGATGNYLKYSSSGTAVWSTPTSADITESTSKKFVSDTEKTAWNAKASTDTATTASNGLMSSTDKSKLDGVETGAQVNAITSVNGATGAITGLATDTSVDNKIGILNDLQTTEKTNLVGSVNEVATDLDSKAEKDTMGVFLKDFPRLESETNDTSRLNRAISSAPVNTQIIIDSNLYIASEIVVAKSIKFISLNGAKIFFDANFVQVDNTLSMFNINASQVSFEGLTFEGNGVLKGSLNNKFLWFSANVGTNAKVLNCSFKNLPKGGSNFNGAIGFSGNASDGLVHNCYFENCPGAVFSQARRTYISNCTTKQPSDVSFALNSTNCVGSSVVNCKVYAADVTCSIHIGAEEGASDYVISNNYIYGVKDGIGIGCINLGVFTESLGGIISNNIVDGGNYTTTNPSALLSISKYYKNVIVSNNIFKNSPKGNGINAAVSLPLNDITFNNNKVIVGTGASGMGIFINGAGSGSLMLKDNDIDASALARCIHVSTSDFISNKLITTGNRFKNASEGLFFSLATNLKVYMQDDDFENVTNPVNGGVGWQNYFNANKVFKYPYKINEGINMYGNAAPTSGSWKIGDKIYNTTPIAGGYEGWACVLGGTPGTWKGFGMLQV